MTEETDSFSLDLESERIQRELDEEKKKRKERQRIFDDIGVMVAMFTITLFAVFVVVIKVIIFHTEVEERREEEKSLYSILQVNISAITFQPMEQMKSSKIKYTGNGYIPCSG